MLDLGPFNCVFLGKKRSIEVFNTCICEKMKRSGKTLFDFAFTAKKAAVEPESRVSESAHSSTESHEIEDEVVGESDKLPGGGKLSMPVTVTSPFQTWIATLKWQKRKLNQQN